MKNLTKISIITLLTLFISNCGDKVREEITERYDDGKKKTIMKFKGSGSEEVMVEKIGYSQRGDTLILEKPLDKLKMEREYYEDGEIKEEGNYKDGERDGKYTSYYKNGQIKSEGNYKDGERVGKWISYYEDGQIKEEGKYKSVVKYGFVLPIKDGKWTYYNEDGSIKEVRNYKDGELVK